jgi:hypothetical protein
MQGFGVPLHYTFGKLNLLGKIQKRVRFNLAEVDLENVFVFSLSVPGTGGFLHKYPPKFLPLDKS